MTARTSFHHPAFGVTTVLFVLVFAASAHALPRMYTGSLLIAAFGNDITTGQQPPFSVSEYVGIPLTGKCNTVPFHALETLTFPTTLSTPPTQTVMFTIPEYGGQIKTIDTNSDTIPDLVPGCTSTSLGDPLTGSGLINTTGATSTSRTVNDPRQFTLPKSTLNKVKLGEASFEQYGVYLWEVHFADLHNDTAVFRKNGGDGTFDVKHAGVAGKRRATQTAGPNRFGGTMMLLGSYGDNEGYLYNNVTTSVFYFNWLFNYLGAAGQATDAGEVTAGYFATATAYGYTRASGYVATSTVYAEVFRWTTGSVRVTAVQGTFPTFLERKGYDSRKATGGGVVQLVSPMLTHWVGAGESSTAAIGIMTITFAPEPTTFMMLGAGVTMLGLLVLARRRNKR